MVKIAIKIAMLDFMISLIAFIIQNIWTYEADQNIYFQCVDYARNIRIIFFALGICFLLLNAGKELVVIESVRIVAYLFAFLTFLFTLDLIKNWLAYQGVIIWKELFYVKRILHLIALLIANNRAKKKLNHIYN